MIGKETLSTKYYIAFNGDKIDTDPEYFESDDEAFKYFKDNTNVFLEKYNNGTGPNKFTIIEEVSLIKRSTSGTIYPKEYVITVHTDSGTQLYLSCSTDTLEVYFSPSKVCALHYRSKTDAGYFLGVYKIMLVDRYKKELLDTMKVLEIVEDTRYDRNQLLY